MRTTRFKYVKLFAALLAVFICVFSTVAQSSDSNFPTPLTSSVINSSIKARDIGDSRLTTQYFAFGGEQGDIFINVVTRNFDGDIDVFTADGMRPLTKMVIYSDSSITETGRLIYLRKPEKLLIRIEGRPPDDRPATIQVKFGGTFVAMKGKSAKESDAPTVSTSQEGDVRVNSVGTHLPVPEVKKIEKEPRPRETASTIGDVAKKERTPKVETAKESPEIATKRTPQVKSPKPKPPKETSEKPKELNDTSTETEKATMVSEDVTKPKPQPKKPKLEAPKEAEKADPLANIRLVIAFKNGDKLERLLSEVLKFSVDKGTLTVIAKDGSIRRYSMLDVAEVTIK